MKALSLGLLVATPAVVAFQGTLPSQGLGAGVTRTAPLRPLRLVQKQATLAPLRVKPTDSVEEESSSSSSREVAKPFALPRWLAAPMKSAALAALVFLSTFSSFDSAANAANSGGRVGGSGFRSAPSRTRTYASPSSSYSSPSYSPSIRSRTYIAPVAPVPAVPFSPFGYGFGFPFSPFPTYSYGYGVGINPIDVIILGGIAYGAFSILSNRVAGNQWGLDDAEPSSLGSGVTVLKVNVALQVADRSSPSSILGQLDEIASRADVSSRRGLASLVSSTALALLRSSNDWVAAAAEDRTFSRGDSKAEAEYNRLAVRERSKFDRENTLGQMDSSSSSAYFRDNRPTLAVVTLCVAIRGQATKMGSVGSVVGLKKALQTLAADAISDDGENILATEVLWTPQDNRDVLSRSEMVQDYPELIDL